MECDILYRWPPGADTRRCKVTKAARACGSVGNGGNEGASCTELSEVGNARGETGTKILLGS
jgi:hypothetical protein